MVLVQNVSKLYRLYKRPLDRLRASTPFHRRPLFTEFWALRNVTFGLDRGEALGLVGPNGSGKSTLLQVVCGILKPTHGRIVTQGRIAALLELGAGFNPEFTGRENVFLNGEILGLSRSEINRAMPSIEAFAEIGDFMERPVKEYSSGMYVRLAFATAIHVEPDIPIVDEALAVGDAVFANRCVRKFEELRKRRVTVLFVSHDLGLVKHLSQRAILLVNGEMAAEGAPKDVINRYIGLVLERERREFPREAKDSTLSPTFRHGDGSSEIREVLLLNRTGEPVRSVESGEPVTVRVRSYFRNPKADCMVGMLIRNRNGIEVFGTNTRLEEVELGTFAPGEELIVDFSFECWLTPQEYTVTAAAQNTDGTSLDWLDDALGFSVVGGKARAGVADLRARVAWRRRTATA